MGCDMYKQIRLSVQ